MFFIDFFKNNMKTRVWKSKLVAIYETKKMKKFGLNTQNIEMCVFAHSISCNNGKCVKVRLDSQKLRL